MRRIILATLTAGFLLGGTRLVLGECRTLAEARAANPNAHLAYGLAAGGHCWFAGYPLHRERPVTRKKPVQLARVSNADRPDESPPAQAPPDAGNKSERDTGGPSSGPPVNAQSTRIADAFNVVELDTNSVQAPQWRILGLADNVEDSDARQPPQQPAPPIRAPVRYTTLAAWLLLTVGVATMMIAIPKIYRDRLSPSLVRPTRSRDRVRRLRMRDYPNAATPLVNHVDTRVFERDGVSAEGPSPDAQREGPSTDMSSLLRRHR